MKHIMQSWMTPWMSLTIHFKRFCSFKLIFHYCISKIKPSSILSQHCTVVCGFWIFFFYKWVHLKLTSSLRTYLACSVTSTEWVRICYPFGLIWTNCWLAFYEIIVCNPLSGLRRLINYKIARLASSMSFINHADTFWSSLNVEVWKKARMSLDDPSSTFQTDLRPHILCHSA